MPFATGIGPRFEAPRMPQDFVFLFFLPLRNYRRAPSSCSADVLEELSTFEGPVQSLSPSCFLGLISFLRS